MSTGRSLFLAVSILYSSIVLSQVARRYHLSIASSRVATGRVKFLIPIRQRAVYIRLFSFIPVAYHCARVLSRIRGRIKTYYYYHKTAAVRSIGVTIDLATINSNRIRQDTQYYYNVYHCRRLSAGLVSGREGYFTLTLTNRIFHAADVPLPDPGKCSPIRIAIRLNTTPCRCKISPLCIVLSEPYGTYNIIV